MVKYKNIVFCDSNGLGRCSTLEHQIDTGYTAPIRIAPRGILCHQQEEVQHDIAEKEHSGIIKKSNSPWTFSIVVVRKKDGTVRIFVDYRRLNDITRKNAHPLPLIEDIFDALRGSKYFSTLDLASGYAFVTTNSFCYPLGPLRVRSHAFWAMQFAC